jgi:hypothetical protein
MKIKHRREKQSQKTNKQGRAEGESLFLHLIQSRAKGTVVLFQFYKGQY